MEDYVSILQKTGIFRDLSTKQIEKVLNISHTVTFAQNEIVMKEGAVGDSLYIILEGTVEVIKQLVMNGIDEEEKSKIFTRLDAGQHAVFGEIALLEESKRTATIKAVTDCFLYEIKKDDFLKLAQEDTELGFRILLNLARIVSTRLRKADDDTIKLTTALSIILKEL
jgi:CRP-like cAMP-binding protein